MKTLIAFVVVLGVACATPGGFRNPLGDVAHAVVGGAAGLAEGVVGGAVGLANGAAHVIDKAADVIFGFQHDGRAEFASLFHYYTNIGIIFHVNYGCCSCPAPGVVHQGSPIYSPYSPFYIHGVYQIHGTHFCTCPPELVASAVEAARYSPEILGHIDQYVVPIPLQGGGRYVRNTPW